MAGQDKKNNNRKLVLLFIGLIVIGIVCMKLKKSEQYQTPEQQKKNPAEAAYDQFKNTFF